MSGFHSFPSPLKAGATFAAAAWLLFLCATTSTGFSLTASHRGSDALSTKWSLRSTAKIEWDPSHEEAVETIDDDALPDFMYHGRSNSWSLPAVYPNPSMTVRARRYHNDPCWYRHQHPCSSQMFGRTHYLPVRYGWSAGATSWHAATIMSMSAASTTESSSSHIPSFLEEDDRIDLNSNWIQPSKRDTDEVDLVMSEFIDEKQDRSLAVSDDGDKDENEVWYYDVGISGTLMETGALSDKIYTALRSSRLLDNTSLSSSSLPNQVNLTETTLRQMTLELTALEVLQVLLKQSGLELYVNEDRPVAAADAGTAAVTAPPPSSAPPKDEATMFSWSETVESIRLLKQQKSQTQKVATVDEKATLVSNDIQSKKRLLVLGGKGNQGDYDFDEDEPMFASLEDAVAMGEWAPGQGFGLVLRRVPVTRQRVSLPELLASLDPDGTLRQQALEAGILKEDEASNSAAQPNSAATDEANKEKGSDTGESMYSAAFFDTLEDLNDITSLAQLAAFNQYRTELAPRPVSSRQNVYTGTNAPSYRVISARSLQVQQGSNGRTATDTHDEATIRHVMNALVSHGCLLVDVTNGGTDWEDAHKLHALWKATERLFDYVDEAETFLLPGLHSVADQVGATHAKLGFASYQDGNLQCLETRHCRTTGALLPIETRDVLGLDACSATIEAFATIAQLCQQVVHLVVAASIQESNDDVTSDEANQAAARLAREILDNGLPLERMDDDVSASSLEAESTSAVSMSPHRLCRYKRSAGSDEGDEVDNEVLFGTSNKPPSTAAVNSDSEIFGAHTDSTFITAIPVTAVAGLEVFDEAADCWYRPELAALRHYEQQQQQARASGNGGVSDEAESLPWYARYVLLMPGELLQLVSRNEVLATVHRVIVLAEQSSSQQKGDTKSAAMSSRLSAPILLRGRPGVRFNCQRYLGTNEGEVLSPLLQQCNGQSMEQIDAAMMYKSR